VFVFVSVVVSRMYVVTSHACSWLYVNVGGEVRVFCLA
jgi:membrane-associated PAP2 superfamily phosphatase